MVYHIADNIISPLGMTTDDNVDAVLQGQTGLACHGKPYSAEPFTASLFAEGRKAEILCDGLTLFESAVARSAGVALAQAHIDAASDRLVLIVSTTKGNVDLLSDDDNTCDERLYPGVAACRVARAIGVITMPVVVCNACVSGLSAMILAMRLIENGTYDYAVVCGCDVQSRFIVTGFQSLKTLSATPCRPFDMQRTGLNVGEAAATVVLSRRPSSTGGGWVMETGCVRNDASHISTPSRTGEGLYRALTRVAAGVEDVDHTALLNVHGTGTLFNDAMEAAAIRRAGLTAVPVNALKGYFGHTMGACGVLETIVTMHALDRRIIPATRGFAELGVSAHIDITDNNRATDCRRFIKTLSGFGGCNAVASVSRQDYIDGGCASGGDAQARVPLLKTAHRVTATPQGVSVDGRKLCEGGAASALLTYIYKEYMDSYPKFHKMDMLGKLGFAASELLLKAAGVEREQECEDWAVVFFNRTTSTWADWENVKSLHTPDGCFPSPSAFVRTLPNIVTGEIAIRNHWYGETAFYVLPEKNEAMMRDVMSATARDTTVQHILGGWLDIEDEARFEADLLIMEIERQETK